MSSDAQNSNCKEENAIPDKNLDHTGKECKVTDHASEPKTDKPATNAYSTNKKLIAESLREHLVIEHEKDKSSLLDGINSDSVVGKLKDCDDEKNCGTGEKGEQNDELNSHNIENEKVTEPATSPTQEKGGAQVTMVKRGTQSYTKITSPGSAFTPTNIAQENRSKRLKNDPHLQHLLPQSKKTGKTAPLLRSTSMPVCVESELSDGESSDKPSSGEKGVLQHRTIFRTGSVSDYTRQKLKTSILMRTSASLVRKPSITEQEIRHLQADADSSLSDDDEEDIDEDMSAQFKPVCTSAEAATETSGPLTCGAESGAVDSLRRENASEVPTSSLVSSALTGPSVSHALVITTT